MFSSNLITRLKKAYQICVLTGQGMSVESGAPLILQEEGTWNNYDTGKLSTQKAMQNESDKFWDFYHARRKALESIKPNLGHYSLVDIEQMIKKFYLVTLTDDNLHRLAGSTRVAELYGNISRSRCTSCDFSRSEELKGYDQKGILKCPKCNNILRPDIILLDENISQRTIDAVNQAAATSEIFISISVSHTPKVIDNLPLVAKGNGAYLLEINNKETELTPHTNEFVEGDSGKILPHLVTALTDS